MEKHTSSFCFGRSGLNAGNLREILFYLYLCQTVLFCEDLCVKGYLFIMASSAPRRGSFGHMAVFVVHDNSARCREKEVG